MLRDRPARRVDAPGRRERGTGDRRLGASRRDRHASSARGRAFRSCSGSCPASRRMVALRYNNYGKGVMFWETDAEAARFVNAPGPGVGRHLLVHGRQHLLTMGGRGAAERKHPIADARAVSPRVQLRRDRQTHAQARCGRGGRSRCGRSSRSGTRSRRITGRRSSRSQVRAAVWHSLIAGARGIIYFNHSFGGPNVTQHALREPAYRARSIRRQAGRTGASRPRPRAERPDCQLRLVAAWWHQGDGEVDGPASVPVRRLRGIGRSGQVLAALRR